MNQLITQTSILSDYNGYVTMSYEPLIEVHNCVMYPIKYIYVLSVNLIKNKKNVFPPLGWQTSECSMG